MKNKPTRALLDIAILTSGRSDLFETCVAHVLKEMKPEYRLHIVNNGSPSAEYERIYKLLPLGTTIKRLNQNTGFGGGANTAIRLGNAPLVLFVSDDIFIQPGAIDSLIRTMDEPTIGMCGYKFLFPPDSNDPGRPAGKVQHIGMATNISGEMIHPLMGWSADNKKCCVSRPAIAVTGASFMIRRSIFNRVGGFDPAYGKGYYEDMDLCFKIRTQGLGNIFVNTDAVAYHVVGQSYSNDETRPLLQQNRMVFRARWVNSMPWTEWEFW